LYYKNITSKKQLDELIQDSIENILMESSDVIKIKNHDTGRMINAQTALSYGIDHPAYKIAKKALGDDSETPESTGVHPKDKKALNNAISKTKSSLSLIRSIGKDDSSTSAMKIYSNLSGDFHTLLRNITDLTKSNNPQTKKNGVKFTKQIVDVLNKEINDVMINKKNKLSPSLEKTMRHYQKSINDAHKKFEKS